MHIFSERHAAMNTKFDPFVRDIHFIKIVYAGMIVNVSSPGCAEDSVDGRVLRVLGLQDKDVL